jgi:predicted component of type VI protein secretion system
MDGNDKLEGLLSDIIQNSGAQQQLSKELGLDSAAGSGGKEGDE